MPYLKLSVGICCCCGCIELVEWRSSFLSPCINFISFGIATFFMISSGKDRNIWEKSLIDIHRLHHLIHLIIKISTLLILLFGEYLHGTEISSCSMVICRELHTTASPDLLSLVFHSCPFHVPNHSGQPLTIVHELG